MSCLGAVGTICPRISLTYYTALASKFKGVMFQSIFWLATKAGLGSVYRMRNESGAI